MHFCMDELYAIMMAVPFLGYFVLRSKHLFHRIFHRKSVTKVISDGCCKHTPKHEE